MTRREKLLCIPLAATIAAWLMAPTGGYPSQPTFISALIGAATTGGNMGAGSLNANALYIQGAPVATAASVPVGANPTATLGLSAINGSATTWMRSDAAPALSQAIVPTWTGNHVFTAGVAVTGGGITSSGFFGNCVTTTTQVVLNGNNSAQICQSNSGGVANSRMWDNFADTTSHLHFRSVNDASTVANDWLTVTAASGAPTAITLGAATTISGNETVNGTGLITGSTTIQGGLGVSNGALANVANFSSTSSNGSYICEQNSGGNIICEGSASSLFGLAVGDGAVASQGATTLHLGTNARDAIDIFNTGDVNIQAPASGNALTVTAVLGGNAAIFTAPSSANQSFGIYVNAGTSSSDRAMLLQNAATTSNLFAVMGDGGAIVGSPTGGDKGLGTLNAQTLYVNGVAVTALSMQTVVASAGGSGSCSVAARQSTNASYFFGSTCTRISAGSYNITMNGFGSIPFCVASTSSAAGSAVVNFSSSTSGSLASFNSAGTATDATVNISCFGN